MMHVRRTTIILIAVLMTGCINTTPADQSPAAVNDPAPRLLLPDLDGNTIDLDAYNGQVVLLNYWNIACPPCLEELPVFEALHQSYDQHQITIIAVHLGGPLQSVKDFIADNDYTFTVAIDEDLSSSLPPLPTTYIVDRKGIVRHRWIGGPLGQEEILEEAGPYLKDSE